MQKSPGEHIIHCHTAGLCAKRDTIHLERDTIHLERDTIHLERDTVHLERDTIHLERDTIHLESLTHKKPYFPRVLLQKSPRDLESISFIATQQVSFAERDTIQLESLTQRNPISQGASYLRKEAHMLLVCQTALRKCVSFA